MKKKNQIGSRMCAPGLMNFCTATQTPSSPASSLSTLSAGFHFLLPIIPCAAFNQLGVSSAVEEPLLFHRIIKGT